MTARWAAATLLVAAACGGGPPPPPPPPAADHAAAVEAWRAERLAGLRRPDGWLSLAGLYWLEEGDNSFGTDPTNDLVFPKGPPRLGVLHRAGREVWLEPARGERITWRGKPVERLAMEGDRGGEPTTVAHGSLRFHLIERGERIGLRLKDLESELLAGFDGIDHFPVDPGWRLAARFEPFAEPRTIPVPNIIGDVFEQPCHGELVFSIDGAEHRLLPLGDPGEELFVVFGDATNGRESYGGGRFLDTEPPDAQGRLVVDFNQAYNPPCVFTPWATCPLPPPGNTLALAVTAGEKSFGGVH